MTQVARLESLEMFRTKEACFLLATDVAARGLDISGVQVGTRGRTAEPTRSFLGEPTGPAPVTPLPRTPEVRGKAQQPPAFHHGPSDLEVLELCVCVLCLPVFQARGAGRPVCVHVCMSVCERGGVRAGMQTCA